MVAFLWEVGGRPHWKGESCQCSRRGRIRTGERHRQRLPILLPISNTDPSLTGSIFPCARRMKKRPRRSGRPTRWRMVVAAFTKQNRGLDGVGQELEARGGSMVVHR